MPKNFLGEIKVRREGFEVGIGDRRVRKKFLDWQVARESVLIIQLYYFKLHQVHQKKLSSLHFSKDRIIYIAFNNGPSKPIPQNGPTKSIWESFREMSWLDLRMSRGHLFSPYKRLPTRGR